MTNDSEKGQGSPDEKKSALDRIARLMKEIGDPNERLQSLASIEARTAALAKKIDDGAIGDEDAQKERRLIQEEFARLADSMGVTDTQVQQQLARRRQARERKKKGEGHGELGG